MIGFGLDLSGYSSGGTVLAAVQIAGDRAAAVLLRGSAFSKYRHGVDDAKVVLAEERQALAECLKVGSLAVDVPIDLQGLPAPEGCTFLWEFTKRPIDYAFGGMSPLADRLGACVARFKAVLAGGEMLPELGRRLFETYPAATLKLLDKPNRGYKGAAGRDLCREISNGLGLDNCNLADHELDAIICAVTVAAPGSHRLEGKRLVQLMHKIDEFTEMTDLKRGEPEGFVLLDKWPCRRVEVSEEDFQSWMDRQGRSAVKFAI